jgi:signal transduction histidine kinase
VNLLLRPWRALARAFARRLSWKLTLSHLTVAVICQIVYIIGAVFVIISVAQTNAARDRLPLGSREMAEGTRIMAIALAPTVSEGATADLAATLARLPPTQATGFGAFDGVLSPTNLLVVVAPDGAILAASEPDVAALGTAGALDPPVLGAVLTAALANGPAPDPTLAALTGRDDQGRRLVTAYPIADDQGRIIGALGLRSAAVPRAGSSPNFGAAIASVSLALLALFLVIGLASSFVASIAGFLLARAFGRRLRQLEGATEAIARGDLAARVAVTVPDEIGRVGARFNLLTERLGEVDRARRAFVSNISHELRTPLAIIRGHVEAQLARDPAAAPSREALVTIDREARTLGGLIDDLFTLTRIEETALPLAPAPVELHEVAAAAVAGIRPLAAAQGHIAIQSLVPADLPPALADRTRLGQILNNLLYNALRHTPDGGVIVVEGAASADGQALELAVTDTGTGIAPDDLPHIFDRFYRGEVPDGARGGGTGLGLAIVKSLVEAQGGMIGAESVLGEGTTIRFTLPRAR